MGGWSFVFQTLIIIAAIVGLVSGLAFAPLFNLVATRVSGRTVRAGASAIIGALSGAIGVYVSNSISKGLVAPLGLGGTVGALIGVCCSVFCKPQYDRQNTNA